MPIVTYRYIQGETLVHKLDPRVKLLMIGSFVISVSRFLDLRPLLPLLLFSLSIYLAARIPFKDVKTVWKYLTIFLLVITGINNLFFPVGLWGEELRPLFQIGPLKVTLEGMFYSLAVVTRFLTVAMPAILFIYTTDPSLFGVTFAKIGLPDKIAYAFDLAMRYVPTLIRNMESTINSQRARGYEVDAVKGGVIHRVLRVVPLIVPVTIDSAVSTEEISDAMELRCFGVAKRRTWYYEIRMRKIDYIFVAIFLAMVITSIILSKTLFKGLWVPF